MGPSNLKLSFVDINLKVLWIELYLLIILIQLTLQTIWIFYQDLKMCITICNVVTATFYYLLFLSIYFLTMQLVYNNNSTTGSMCSEHNPDDWQTW